MTAVYPECSQQMLSLSYILQITSRDMLDDRKASLNKFLIITQEAGGYVWRVDGQVRTVTTAAPADVDGNVLVLGERYRLENRASRTWMSDCVGEYLARVCRYVCAQDVSIQLNILHSAPTAISRLPLLDPRAPVGRIVR